MDMSKYCHLTSLEQIADLPEEDKRELDEFLSDFESLFSFLERNKLLQEAKRGGEIPLGSRFPSGSENYVGKADSGIRKTRHPPTREE